MQKEKEGFKMTQKRFVTDLHCLLQRLSVACPKKHIPTHMRRFFYYKTTKTRFLPLIHPKSVRSGQIKELT